MILRPNIMFRNRNIYYHKYLIVVLFSEIDSGGRVT